MEWLLVIFFGLVSVGIVAYYLDKAYQSDPYGGA
jgi:uncharacterized protein (UPF0333 family)